MKQQGTLSSLLPDIDQYSGLGNNDDTQIIYKQTIPNNIIKISDKDSFNSKDITPLA